MHAALGAPFVVTTVLATLQAALARSTPGTLVPELVDILGRPAG